MLIMGVTSEWPDGALTLREGYDAMLSQLQSHASTYQSSIDYLTRI
jgi:hypothetical protein